MGEEDEGRVERRVGRGEKGESMAWEGEDGKEKGKKNRERGGLKGNDPPYSSTSPLLPLVSPPSSPHFVASTVCPSLFLHFPDIFFASTSTPGIFSVVAPVRYYSDTLLLQ